MLDFIAIFNLMKQAPEFSTVISSLFIYFAYFYITTKNKETMGIFVKNEINASEARIKEYIDQNFKALKNGL